MQFFLLLFLLLPCLPERWAEPSWVGSANQCALWTWGALLCPILFVYLLRYWLRAQLRRPVVDHEALLKTYARAKWVHTGLLYGLYLLALYGFGWGGAVQHWLGGPDLLVPGGELLILAPFLVGLVGSWQAFYGLELAIHQSIDRDYRAPRWTKLAYLTFQIRSHLALVFLPLLLLIAEKALRRNWPNSSGVVSTCISIVGTLGLFVFMPWLLRLVLGLQPLPASPLRDRLEAASRRLHFRCSDILLWNTRGGVVNAMVVGVLPQLRYVLLTDRMLQELSPAEIEAVFGHEVGHVKHQHLLYYFGFLLLSMSTVWTGAVWFAEWADSQFSWLHDLAEEPWFEQWSMIPVVALLGTYIFLVFGYLSRRCERQADVYGCRAISCTRSRQCTGTHDDIVLPQDAKGLCLFGIDTFISALEKVCHCNGMSRDKPSWLQSWQHSTIARRVAFLELLRTQPQQEHLFQRRLLLLRWSLMVVLCSVLLLLGLTYGWDKLLKHLL